MWQLSSHSVILPDRWAEWDGGTIGSGFVRVTPLGGPSSGGLVKGGRGLHGVNSMMEDLSSRHVRIEMRNHTRSRCEIQVAFTHLSPYPLGFQSLDTRSKHSSMASELSRRFSPVVRFTQSSCILE